MKKDDISGGLCQPFPNVFNLSDTKIDYQSLYKHPDVVKLKEAGNQAIENSLYKIGDKVITPKGPAIIKFVAAQKTGTVFGSNPWKPYYCCKPLTKKGQETKRNIKRSGWEFDEIQIIGKY